MQTFVKVKNVYYLERRLFPNDRARGHVKAHSIPELLDAIADLLTLQGKRQAGMRYLSKAQQYSMLGRRSRWITYAEYVIFYNEYMSEDCWFGNLTRKHMPDPHWDSATEAHWVQSGTTAITNLFREGEHSTLIVGPFTFAGFPPMWGVITKNRRFTRRRGDQFSQFHVSLMPLDMGPVVTIRATTDLILRANTPYEAISSIDDLRDKAHDHPSEFMFGRNRI